MATNVIKDNLIGLTVQAKTFLMKDLKAIPSEKQNQSFGGCSRTALSMVTECGIQCDVIGQMLRGGDVKRLTEDEKSALYSAMNSEENVLAFLEEKVSGFLAILAECDEATFSEPCPAFSAFPMTRFAVAQLPGVHMMYHDGQLNYIQTLLNDDKIHWL